MARGYSGADRALSLFVLAVLVLCFFIAILAVPHDGPAWLLGMRPVWPVGVAFGAMLLVIFQRSERVRLILGMRPGRVGIGGLFFGLVMARLAMLFGPDAAAFVMGWMLTWLLAIIALFGQSFLRSLRGPTTTSEPRPGDTWEQ